MSHRVLIVEDESVVLTFVETVLKSRGHEVLTARTAAEARAILNTLPADADLCLVIDVVLERESGITLAQEVIERNRGYRVLLVSGFTDEVLLALPEHSERIAFLRKPFSSAQLAAAVDSVCEV